MTSLRQFLDASWLIRKVKRPAILIEIGALLLALGIIALNTIVLYDLRNSTMRTAEADLTRYSLTLAEQADRSFKSLDLVIASVIDHVEQRKLATKGDVVAAVADFQTHVLLKEKLSGLPQVDAITIIDARGRLLNFSRYWPIPDVNVSDRDYFQALSRPGGPSTFISEPVRNRGTGTWTIYLARRLVNKDGAFSGLVLGAMALQHFEDFYGAISLGESSAISLMRNDGTMLVRHPRTEEVGKRFANAPRILGESNFGLLRELSPIDNRMRIKAAKRLANFPLFVLATITEESVLTPWRRLAELLAGMSLAIAMMILLAAGFVTRLWRKQQIAARAVEDTARAEAARAEAEASLLRERERVADAASKAKSSFLAVMSHEIRTPLNSVLGLTGALLEGGLTPEQRKTLETIQEAGDGLLEILNDILDHSKLDSGELTLERIPFAPREVTDSVLAILAARAKAKGLAVDVVTDDGLPAAVLGDVGRLRQVLLNLVSNAVKFTKIGRITISCRCVERLGASAVIEWIVTDTGIGISEERIGSLFHDYVQADCTINRRFGGSGLGLSICRRIISAMGGKIEASSKLGHGTTMRFSLELAVTEPIQNRAREAGASVAELEAIIARLGRPLRVLIADDNATNQLVAARMLDGLHVQHNMVGDGAEALASSDEIEFDVILMDVRMPEMDGLAATRQIRARGQRTPIIGFTANAYAEDIAACMDAGMNEFVAKPVRKAVLLSAIVKCLQASEAADACRVPLPSPTDTSMPAFDAPWFDRDEFEALAQELGDDGIDEALGSFLQEAAGRIAKLEANNLETRRTEIEREAHTIKGTAATFGFTRLSQLAAWLEKNARKIEADEYKRTCSLLKCAMDEARKVMLACGLPSCRALLKEPA